MAACYVGLGGNVGDVREAFREAVRRLRSTGLDVTSLSGLYRTAAVGEQAGPPFLNAAIAVRTTLEPEPVLDLLQEVEQSLGRTRELHWGPRTIDLDLLLFESRIMQTPRLTLPHPACWYRRFVLDPLAEIAGSQLHPERRLTIRELRDRLQIRPLHVVLAGGDRTLREQLTCEINRRFGGQVEIDALSASPEPAFTFCFPDSRLDDVPPASLVQIVESVDAVSFVRDILQAATDIPERIAGPDDWGPRED